MNKVQFIVSYEILADKKEEYLNVIREMKHLIKADGLESYEVYSVKGKENRFEEVYTFIDSTAYENFDDIEDTRLSILMNKLSELVVEHSTNYKTLYEII